MLSPIIVPIISGKKNLIQLVKPSSKKHTGIPFALLIGEVSKPSHNMTIKARERLSLQRQTTERLCKILTTAFPSWNFSKSHSGKYAAVMASPVMCGLDLEILKNREIKQIVRRVSHQREWEIVEKHFPESHERSLYYMLWSIKEACYKAVSSRGPLSVIFLNRILNVSDMCLEVVALDKNSGAEAICISFIENELVVSLAFSSQVKGALLR